MPKLTEDYIVYGVVSSHGDVPTPPVTTPKKSIAIYIYDDGGGAAIWLKDDTGAYGKIDGLAGASIEDLPEVDSVTATANLVLATPDGSSGNLSTRTLVADDLPDVPTSKLVGTLAASLFADNSILLSKLPTGGTEGNILQYNASGVLVEAAPPSGGSGSLPVPSFGFFPNSSGSISSSGTTDTVAFRANGFGGALDPGGYCVSDNDLYLTIPSDGYYKVIATMRGVDLSGLGWSNTSAPGVRITQKRIFSTIRNNVGYIDIGDFYDPGSGAADPQGTATCLLYMSALEDDTVVVEAYSPDGPSNGLDYEIEVAIEFMGPTV